MKVLYSHHGMKGKNGWGRTFYMAQGLADLGHDVTLLTINPKCSFFKINTIIYQGVKIKVLPDFFPAKMKSSGFAIWSTLFGLIYSMFHKFEICIADCGHRFTSLPCKLNRFIYHSVYISEWWDFFGKGGYIKKKSRLFRLTYGRLECYNELNDKRKADAIVVLSTFMKDRAVENGIDSEKIFIVPGGSIVKDVKPLYPSYSSVEKRKINIAYIGINNHEIDLIAPFIEALKCENVKNSYRLILYGNTISNEKWNQLGLSEIAEYRGWLDYSKDVSTLKDIDVFLQLLDDNNVSKAGWPNKLGDYLAFGKPVILSPYGDIIDFVKNEKGFFIVEYNKYSILKILQEIKDIPYSDLKTMGYANRQLAEKISWKNRAKNIDHCRTAGTSRLFAGGAACPVRGRWGKPAEGMAGRDCGLFREDESRHGASARHARSRLGPLPQGAQVILRRHGKKAFAAFPQRAFGCGDSVSPGFPAFLPGTG